MFGVYQIFGRIFDRGIGETNEEIWMKVLAQRTRTFIQISGATYLGSRPQPIWQDNLNLGFSWA